MSRPPIDPRDRPAHKQPTWQNILVSFAMVIAIPFVIWIVSQPLTGIVVLTAIVALFTGTRRAYRLARCFYDCEAFAFDVGGKARITVTQLSAEDAN